MNKVTKPTAPRAPALILSTKPIRYAVISRPLSPSGASASAITGSMRLCTPKALRIENSTAKSGASDKQRLECQRHRLEFHQVVKKILPYHHGDLEGSVAPTLDPRQLVEFGFEHLLEYIAPHAGESIAWL